MKRKKSENIPPDAKKVINQINKIRAGLYQISLCAYSPEIATRFAASKREQGTEFKIEVPNFDPTLLTADISYQEMWSKMNTNNQFTCRMIDGGLITFLYTFDSKQKGLIKSRLSFFPCYDLPNLDEAKKDYQDDRLYLDIFQKTAYPSSLRFDYDPFAFKDVNHPKSHLTLGQFSNCRIPVYGPLTPYNFINFIIRNFYNSEYEDWCKVVSQIPNKDFSFSQTITPHEKSITHIAIKEFN